MVIGNPLYDTIFKYLMEDPEIAKRLIGIIIGEDITEIRFAAQERVRIEPSYPLALFRMDFIATIATAAGPKNVLIEVQKAKRSTDISRFRTYLGKQYSERESILPLITIYFLGYNLDDLPESVIRVERQVRGLVSGAAYEVKNEFVELLTHEAYLVQVNRLRRPLRTPLERVLSIFDQSQRLKETYLLEYPEEEIPAEVEPMVRRLRGVTRDEALREQLELEEELEYEYRMTIGKKEAEIAAIEARAKVDRQRAEQEAQRAEQEAQRAEQEKLRAEQALERSQQLEEALQRSVRSMHRAGMDVKTIAAALQLDETTVERLLG